MPDRTRRNLITGAAIALPATAAALLSKSTEAAPKGGSSATTLVSNFVPGTGGFVGTATVTGFSVVNGVLSATVSLVGDVLSATGGLVGSTSQTAVMPAAVSASCTILSLTLGPLDLNLLGLMVHLNQVVLNITAVPGAGNLLGNLLCSVANLLNGGGAISTLLNNLASLLNQILGAL